jgi:cell division protein FtsL
MVTGELIALIAAIVVVLSFIGTFIARISKLETRADVCDEKHRENEQKHLKQDAVNLRIEEHHIEVMTAISAISTKLDLTSNKK